MDFLMALLAGLFLFLVFIALTQKGIFALDEGIFGSLGNCQDACKDGETKVSDSCKQGGVVQPDKVRCFEVSDFWTKKEDTKEDGTTTGGTTDGTTPAGTPVIEARLGVDLSENNKYMKGMYKSLDANSGKTKFSVWAARGSAYTCDIKFFKMSGTNPIEIPTGSFLSGKNVPDRPCIDVRPDVHANNLEERRQGIIILEFDPKEQDIGDYRINLLVRDRQRKIVASESLTLRIKAPTCNYPSCNRIFQENDCTNAKQLGCNFECEFDKTHNVCIDKAAGTQSNCQYTACSDISGNPSTNQYECDITANKPPCNLECEWRFTAGSGICVDTSGINYAGSSQSNIQKGEVGYSCSAGTDCNTGLVCCTAIGVCSYVNQCA